MMFFDSHCHLDFPEFAKGMPTHLNSARESGVSDILIPGVVASNWNRVLSLASADHGVNKYAALGLHPCFMAQHSIKSDISLLDHLLDTHKEIVAVGECGLDLFIDDPQIEDQQSLLDAQLSLAKRYNLPVVLHVRRAVDLVLKALRRHQLARGGIAHAFSGSVQQALQLHDLGFLIGVGGSVTYPRAQRLRVLVSTCPIEWIALETDAPDMPLSGFQGQINQPYQVRAVAQTVSELRGESLEYVAQQTRNNVLRLLRLLA